ncbi:MAG: hypothetical protein M0R03_23225 [Novosphingobium sp.]|nr:hypothetical protein [Novosphingobium sp.]
MEEAIRLIKNIIDYDSCEKWGRALQYAVKVLEEHDKEKVSEERKETSFELTNKGS